MTTIDLHQLTTIVGGADSRNKLVLDKLNQRFGDDGAVSFIGKPHYGRSHDGVAHVTGKVDVNALWGGDTQRSFSADVNRRAQSVANLHSRVIGSE